ncbi:MAG: hypothetical protein AB7G23_03010 [Vicinamibacterales bacterium]
MWKLFTVGPFAPGFRSLRNMPDASGAGAAPASGGASPAPAAPGSDGGHGDEGIGDGGDASGEEEAAAHGADHDEDLDDLIVGDDDEEAPGRDPQEAIKALRARNRKLRRQMAKRLGTLKRLEGVDLDAVMRKASQYDEFERAAQRNPRLKSLLQGDDDAADGAAPARKGGKKERAAFDEKALPFDPRENPVNEYFAGLARTNHELQQTVQDLADRLESLDRRDQQRTEGSQRQQWAGALTRAAEQVTDEGVRTVFIDAVKGAYRDPEVRAKYTPEQVIGHYLKTLKIAPQQAARAAAAAKARVAKANTTLPRVPQTTGTPAPARSGARESLKDVAKRLRAIG